MVLYTCFLLVRLDLFGYIGYHWVYLSRFTEYWVCYSKCINVLVCFWVLFSLLDILTIHLWVHFSKSTLLKPTVIYYKSWTIRAVTKYISTLIREASCQTNSWRPIWAPALLRFGVGAKPLLAMELPTIH